MGPVHRKFADLETKRPDRPKPAGLQVVRFRGEARTLLDGPLGSRPANGAMQGVESWTNPTSAVNYLQAATPFAENEGFDPRPTDCHSRSDERRVGTGCVKKCRSLWSPYQ